MFNSTGTVAKAGAPGLEISKWVLIKNVSWLLGGQLLANLCRFGFGILVAQHLAKQDYGFYGYLVSLAGLIGYFTEAGMSTIGVRYIISEGKASWQILSGAFLIKTAAILAAVAVVAGYAVCQGLNAAFFLGFSILMVGLWLRAFSESANIIFQAHLANHYRIWMQLISQSFLLLGALALKRTEATTLHYLVLLALADILGSLISCGYCLRLSKAGRAKIWSDIWEGLRFSHALKLVKEGWPFALISAIGALYFRADILLVERFLGPEAVGNYFLAFRFLEGTLIVPTAIGMVLYPIFCNAWNTDRPRLVRMYHVTLKAMVILTGLMSLLLSSFAAQLITLLFGTKFVQAIPTLQLLAWNILIVSMATVNLNICWALRWERLVLLSYIVALLLNLGLNWVIIPSYGILGTALVSLVTVGVTVIITSVVLCRQLGFPASGMAAALLLVGIIWLTSFWSHHALVPLAFMFLFIILKSPLIFLDNEREWLWGILRTGG